MVLMSGVSFLFFPAPYRDHNSDIEEPATGFTPANLKPARMIKRSKVYPSKAGNSSKESKAKPIKSTGSKKGGIATCRFVRMSFMFYFFLYNIGQEQPE